MAAVVASMKSVPHVATQAPFTLKHRNSSPGSILRSSPSFGATPRKVTTPPRRGPQRQGESRGLYSPMKSQNPSFKSLTEHQSLPLAHKEQQGLFMDQRGLLASEFSTPLQIGFFSTQGVKPKDPSHVNQDAHLEVNLSDGRLLVGVFDGHGRFGALVSQSVKCIFAELAPAIASASDVGGAFQQAFAEARNRILKENIGHESGTTATVALVDLVTRSACIAYVGDSTAVVLDPRGSISFQSQDHKPSAESESQRLRSYGTQVRNGRVPLKSRPDSHLGLARSIGDFVYAQQGVIAEPDVILSVPFELGSSLILASDGVWDVLPKEHVAKMIIQSIAQDAPQRIVSLARSLWESMPHNHIDDITAVVLKSVPPETGKGFQNGLADVTGYRRSIVGSNSKNSFYSSLPTFHSP